MYFFSHLCWLNRARRRKKLAKALERQARKLRAKGIAVDFETLKAEYLAQHRGNMQPNDSDIDEDDIQIDVVGDVDSDDDDEPEDFSFKSTLSNGNLNSFNLSNSPSSGVSYCKSETGGDVATIERNGGINIGGIGIGAGIRVHLDRNRDRDSSPILTDDGSNLMSDNNSSEPPKNLSIRQNPFSIESLLYNNT